MRRKVQRRDFELDGLIYTAVFVDGVLEVCERGSHIYGMRDDCDIRRAALDVQPARMKVSTDE